MELTIDQALKKGVEAHKAGKLQEADRFYTAILKAQPKHPDANHNMGVLAVGIGKIQEALPFFKTALETNPGIAQFWLSYIDALVKLNKMDYAKVVLDKAKSKGVKGVEFEQIKKRLIELEKGIGGNAASSKSQEPPQEQLQILVNLYSQGQFQKALSQGSQLLEEFPNSVNLYNIIGASNKGLGNLEEAIEAYNKALSLKPDYADAFYNMGNLFKDQGKLEEAIEAYKKALSFKPDHDDAYYNIGVVLQDQGKLEEAIEAYKKAISIKPDYAQAFNNIGVVHQEQGEKDKALKALNKALSLKPDYADAHRNLSFIKQYKEDDDQIIQVQELYKRVDLSKDARCKLSFTLAKIYEDLGKPDQTFSHLSEGNALRKKLLNYSIDQDDKLFLNLKNSQPAFSKNKFKLKEVSNSFVPIFILGMPRSGTTLVEQIISSHSLVAGAGELRYVSQYGFDLSIGTTSINYKSISDFRNKYLNKLSTLSNKKRFITDKMPQNFRFIPLICSAIPEAKIIHVQRNASATCWSNYKHYFVSTNLGYCYDLKDVVEYYNLYKDLMRLWQSEYSDRIYNLNYDSLTTDQEKHTKQLIKYLDLNWEEACLSPEKNKRSVRTLSLEQVRKKVYKGSSNAWYMYEPYLNGAFDSLKS